MFSDVCRKDLSTIAQTVGIDEQNYAMFITFLIQEMGWEMWEL